MLSRIHAIQQLVIDFANEEHQSPLAPSAPSGDPQPGIIHKFENCYAYVLSKWGQTPALTSAPTRHEVIAVIGEMSDNSPPIGFTVFGEVELRFTTRRVRR